MSDFWQTASETAVPDPPKNTGFNLPDKAAVIVKTTTKDDKDTCQPKIRPIERKDGSGTFYMLKIPMQVIGGDAKIKPNMVGKGYSFPEFNIEAPTAKQLEERIEKAASQGFDSMANRLKGQLKSLDKFPCAPDLYNVLLDCLAPEGETTQARWQAAAAQLEAKANEVGLTQETCKGNNQYLVAAAFHAILMDNSFTLIGQTYTPQQKPGSQYDPRQTVGSIGSYTEAEAKRRKVKLVEPEVKEEDAF